MLAPTAVRKQPNTYNEEIVTERWNTGLGSVMKSDSTAAQVNFDWKQVPIHPTFLFLSMHVTLRAEAG